MKCPLCGAPDIYVGAWQVDCPNEKCRNHVKKEPTPTTSAGLSFENLQGSYGVVYARMTCRPSDGIVSISDGREVGTKSMTRLSQVKWLRDQGILYIEYDSSTKDDLWRVRWGLIKPLQLMTLSELEAFFKRCGVLGFD